MGVERFFLARCLTVVLTCGQQTLPLGIFLMSGSSAIQTFICCSLSDFSGHEVILQGHVEALMEVEVRRASQDYC